MTEDSRVEELVYIMKKVGLNLTAQIDCCLGNQELSGVQTYFLVYFLRHHPEGTYLTEVCHETGMSKATLSALIKKLRGKGYLCFREIPGDIRKKQILPTERLLTEGGELMEKTKQMEEEVCSALSQEEKRQLWVLEQKVLLKLMQMEHKGKNKVNFSYKHGSGKNALSDIDLHIKSGETIGVIGGTGAGKSSLVNLICRLYDVDEGSVCVGGVDVRKYDTEVLRNQVSVVLQKNTLFSGTILDNLRWGNPDATYEECVEACKAACADEFIDRMPGGICKRDPGHDEDHHRPAAVQRRIRRPDPCA